jgi:hypothetical protein
MSGGLIRGSGESVGEVNPSSIETKILKEFNAKQPIKDIPFNQQTTSFILPGYDGRNEKIIRLEDTSSPHKKLIFSMIYTAFYQIFVLEDRAKSQKAEMHTYAQIVTRYLNSYFFESGKEINFFKDFEATRINIDKVSRTGLQVLLKWLKAASEFDRFIIGATWQTHFIDSAEELKALGESDVQQTTLTDWFGYSTWLRQDDLGVGHELYSRLASPKALVKSFIATVTVQLNEIQSAKEALVEFITANKIEPADFPLISKKDDQTKEEHTRIQYAAFNETLNKFRELYHKRLEGIYADQETDSRNLKLAMQFVIREFVFSRCFERVEADFFANKPLTISKKTDGRPEYMYKTGAQDALFGLRFLNELARYVKSGNDPMIDKPKTIAEQTIFSWLMAHQTVQSSDIPKLRLKDFYFVRRNSGRITHIDLEYFKGRTRALHQVQTLETSSLLGTVILRYIEDFSCASKEGKDKKLIDKTNTGQTVLNKMFESCGFEIRECIDENLKREKVSPVFIESMLAILRKGIRIDFKGQRVSDYTENCERRVPRYCFSLSAIKNSSIHARSDTFTPTQLLNYHSHTDKTEKQSYLSPSNEEWLNRSGLITRAVMNDIRGNLFRASDSDRVMFNSEFTRAVETINTKKNDVLARMKLITGKQEGQISELGFLKNSNSTEGEVSDTIYLLDTPETVVKLMHYRAEAERLHHLLLASAPEFLLFTVLPTTEWIEALFDKKSFSKLSVDQGQTLFRKFKEHLPPLFQNQIR